MGDRSGGFAQCCCSVTHFMGSVCYFNWSRGGARCAGLPLPFIYCPLRGQLIVLSSERAAASEVSLSLRSKGSFAAGEVQSFTERERGFTAQLAATGY